MPNVAHDQTFKNMLATYNNHVGVCQSPIFHVCGITGFGSGEEKIPVVPGLFYADDVVLTSSR